MSNFLSDLGKTLWGIAKHPVDEAKFWGKVVTGKTSLKDAPGEHQRMMHKNITSHLGGDSKLAKNSDAVAGAIVGGILAAPVIAGAAGAGGAAAGGGAGTGAMGLSTAYAPTTAFGAGSTGSAFGSTAFGNAAYVAGSAGGSTGALGLGTAYAPTTAFGSTAVAGQGLGMTGYAAGTGSSGITASQVGDMFNIVGKTLNNYEQQTQTTAKEMPITYHRPNFQGVQDNSMQATMLQQETAKVKGATTGNLDPKKILGL